MFWRMVGIRVLPRTSIGEMFFPPARALLERHNNRTRDLSATYRLIVSSLAGNYGTEYSVDRSHNFSFRPRSGTCAVLECSTRSVRRTRHVVYFSRAAQLITSPVRLCRLPPPLETFPKLFFQSKTRPIVIAASVILYVRTHTHTHVCSARFAH